MIKGLLFGILGGVTLYIAILADLLWPLWDRNKQTLHDKIIGTHVVQGPTARASVYRDRPAAGQVRLAPPMKTAAATQVVTVHHYYSAERLFQCGLVGGRMSVGVYSQYAIYAFEPRLLTLDVAEPTALSPRSQRSAHRSWHRACCPASASAT